VGYYAEHKELHVLQVLPSFQNPLPPLMLRQPYTTGKV